MKYLRKFETNAAYTAAKPTLDLPNVSLVTEDYGIHYEPFADPYGGHDYVEIGGLKWATMNVGANTITDYGLFFAWGETSGYTASEVGSGSGKKAFYWTDYKFNPSGDGVTMTKYNETDSKTVLDLDDDAAHVNWGGSWRMPTTADTKALLSSTTTAWTTSYEGSGVSGLVLTDKTDNTKKLFFPAAGYANLGSVYDVGSYGYYWSSSLAASCGVNYAFGLYFGSSDAYWDLNGDRCYGQVVRPVVG